MNLYETPLENLYQYAAALRKNIRYLEAKQKSMLTVQETSELRALRSELKRVGKAVRLKVTQPRLFE